MPARRPPIRRSTIDTDEKNEEYLGQFTQVLSNRTLNEVRGGFSHYGFRNETLVDWSKHWQAPRVTNGYPRITFTGFAINANANAPRHRDQKVWQLRDDFTSSYEAARPSRPEGGRRVRASLRGQRELHPVRRHDCRQQRHRFRPTDRVVVPGSVRTPTRGTCAALSPITRTYTIGIGEFPLSYAQPKYAGWLQDDWRVAGKLTLNLGAALRPEPQLVGERRRGPAVLRAGPSERHEQHSAATRLRLSAERPDGAFAAGPGCTIADALTVDAFWPNYNAQIARIQFNNDGRADFAANPLNGQPLPTFEQAQKLFCDSPGAGGQLRRVAGEELHRHGAVSAARLQEMPAPDQYMQQARNLQVSFGFQRQFGSTMAVEADYVHTQGHGTRRTRSTTSTWRTTRRPAPTTRTPNRAMLPYPAVRRHLDDPAQHAVEAIRRFRRASRSG